MGFYTTVAEYDTAITKVRLQLEKAGDAEEYSLNTSQSSQRVKQNFAGLEKYLSKLCAERQALGERNAGASVTSIQFRRF